MGLGENKEAEDTELGGVCTCVCVCVLPCCHKSGSVDIKMKILVTKAFRTIGKDGEERPGKLRACNHTQGKARIQMGAPLRQKADSWLQWQGVEKRRLEEATDDVRVL